MKQIDDNAILSLFFARSEQAIEALDCKYGSAVRKLAANILNNPSDVEECVNDTYFKVWESIPPKRPNPLVSYVCKIARNTAISRYRSNRAEKRDSRYDRVLDELAECIPSGQDVETEADAHELTIVLNRFLLVQKDEDRFLFVRRYWYADSIADLAAQTDSSQNRISLRLFRMREKLKKELIKEGFLT